MAEEARDRWKKRLRRKVDRYICPYRKTIHPQWIQFLFSLIMALVTVPKYQKLNKNLKRGKCPEKHYLYAPDPDRVNV